VATQMPVTTRIEMNRIIKRIFAESC
jgi:hypothetical protein